MKKAQIRMDEFAFVLLAGIILIAMLMVTWTTPPEPLPVVEPTSISLTIQRGSSATFNLKISPTITNVTLSATGPIAGWITFNKNNFDVVDSETVTAKVRVPKTASIKTYSGNIIVTSTGGEKRVPVNIEVVEVAAVELFSRSISLGDFSIRYTKASKTLDSKEDVEVSKGYFSQSSVNLIGSLSEEELATLESGYIRLIVENTNSLSNLIVLLNNQEVFNQKVGVGELEIPLNISLLKRSNTVTIRTEPPGWMFWATTVYKIRVVELVVNFKGLATKDFAFSLEPEEISNFDHFQLTTRIRDASTPMQELIVKINNQIVFFERPPITFINTTFSRDILGNKLALTPNNTISFSIEKEGYFDLANTVLSIFYGI